MGGSAIARRTFLEEVRSIRFILLALALAGVMMATVIGPLYIGDKQLASLHDDRREAGCPSPVCESIDERIAEAKDKRATMTGAASMALALRLPFVSVFVLLALYICMAGTDRAAMPWSSKTAPLLFSRPVAPIGWTLWQGLGVLGATTLALALGCLAMLVAGVAMQQEAIASGTWALLVLGPLLVQVPLLAMALALGQLLRHPGNAAAMAAVLALVILPAVGAAGAVKPMRDEAYLASFEYDYEEFEDACNRAAMNRAQDYEYYYVTGEWAGVTEEERASFLKDVGLTGVRSTDHSSIRADLEDLVDCRAELFEHQDRFFTANDAPIRTFGVPQALQRLDCMHELDPGDQVACEFSEPDGEIERDVALVNAFDVPRVDLFRYLNFRSIALGGETWGDLHYDQDLAGEPGVFFTNMVPFVLLGPPAGALDPKADSGLLLVVALVGGTAFWLGLAWLDARRRDLV